MATWLDRLVFNVVVITDAQHGNRSGGSLHPLAVSGGAAGFMSGADKRLLGLLSETGGYTGLRIGNEVLESVEVRTMPDGYLSLTEGNGAEYARLSANRAAFYTPLYLPTTSDPPDAAGEISMGSDGRPLVYHEGASTKVVVQPRWHAFAADGDTLSVVLNKAGGTHKEVTFPVGDGYAAELGSGWEECDTLVLHVIGDGASNLGFPLAQFSGNAAGLSFSSLEAGDGKTFTFVYRSGKMRLQAAEYHVAEP